MKLKVPLTLPQELYAEGFPIDGFILSCLNLIFLLLLSLNDPYSSIRYWEQPLMGKLFARNIQLNYNEALYLAVIDFICIFPVIKRLKQSAPSVRLMPFSSGKLLCSSLRSLPI